MIVTDYILTTWTFAECNVSFFPFPLPIILRSVEEMRRKGSI